MKRIIIICLAATAFFVSCRKEPIHPVPSDGVFYANIAETGTTKAFIDGMQIKWQKSDHVMINSSEYVADVISSDATKATLSHVSGTPAEEGNLNKAIFPSSLYRATPSPHYELPSEFVYNSDHFDVPMYAEGKSKELDFNSIFATIKVCLPNDIEVESLVVSSDAYLNGKFIIDNSYLDYVNYVQAQIVEGGDNNKVTTVRFSPTVKAADVYIPIPAGAYGTKNLTFTITGKDGAKQEMSTNESTAENFNAGTLYTYDFRRDGYFEISKEGQIGRDDVL